MIFSESLIIVETDEAIFEEIDTSICKEQPHNCRITPILDIQCQYIYIPLVLSL